MKLVPWSRKTGKVPAPAPASDAAAAADSPASAAPATKARQRYDLPAVSAPVTMFWLLEGPDPNGVVHHELDTECRAPEPNDGPQIGVKLELLSEVAGILPDSGDPVTLRWRSGSREVQVAARVIGYGNRDGAEGLKWKVEVLSEPALTQRRRFVRESVAIPLTVYDGDDHPLAAGNTVDISEGGIAANIDGVRLQENADIRAELILPEIGRVTINGTVLRSAEGRGATIIKFEDGHEHQDTLRQLVFATQIANRQAMLEWES